MPPLPGVPLPVGEEPPVPVAVPGDPLPVPVDDPDVAVAPGRVVVVGLETAGGGVYVVAKEPVDASNRSRVALAGAD